MNTIIEKIRAEIERLQHTDAPHTDEWWAGADYVRRRMKEVLSDLEKEEKPTLQEQPVKTNIVEDLKHYLATTLREEIERKWEELKKWCKVGPSVSEFLGWEQPICEGLEEEIDNRWKEWLSEDKEQVEGVLPKSEFAFYARHFAQWQKEQDEKGLSEKIASAYQLGLADKGKMMMKDAVEATVVSDPDAHGVDYGLQKLEFAYRVLETKGIPNGRKVRIVIVKEDGK